MVFYPILCANEIVTMNGYAKMWCKKSVKIAGKANKLVTTYSFGSTNHNNAVIGNLERYHESATYHKRIKWCVFSAKQITGVIQITYINH